MAGWALRFGQQVRKFARVRQLIQIQNSIPNRGYLSGGDRVAGQFVELLDNVLRARETFLASARRFDGLLEDGSVLQEYFHTDHLPVFRSPRSDIRIFHDFDFFRKRDASRIDDLFIVELIHKYVAREQQRGYAEGQIQLCRGDPFRLILPADMLHGDLRTVHHDVIDIVRGERPSRPYRTNRIERGVIGADTRIKLQGYLHGFEALPQTGGELVQFEPVLRAGERSAKTAKIAFEYVLDSSEPFG